MHKIQDFSNEKYDTPKTKYTMLARFAHETKKCFHKAATCPPLCSQTSKRFKTSLPQVFNQLQGKPMLLQPFTLMERIDNAICFEEVGKLALTMAKSNSKLKSK